MNQKVLKIDWIDSMSDQSWQSAHTPHSVGLCQSIGYLVNEDKIQLTLALNRMTNGGDYPYGSTITIPKVAITHRKQLKY